MKLLYVYGDNDYAAMTWEDKISEENKKIIVDRLLSGEETCIEFEEDYFVELREFDNVDKKFVDFIIDKFMDYDMSKHSNFFVIE